MKLFKKNKTTEEKFEEEKLTRAMITVIRTFRDDKLNLPKNNIIKIILGLCDQIDPDHKMPERELIQKLREREDIADIVKSLEGGAEVLDEDAIKAYAEKYYGLMREALVTTDPKAWDALEFQSQQRHAVWSLKNINILRAHLVNIMDSDATCPFYLKKTLKDLMPDAKADAFTGPTEDDEKKAEEIMRMVCPGLDKSNKDVFRALVDSLKWRGGAELQRTFEAVEKTPPEKRKLRGRQSCVFIESEDTVTYVG